MASAVGQPTGGDEAVDALSRLVDLVNNQAKAGIAHSGALKENLALTTADLEVYHGLGRVPKYVVATLLNANATVFVATPHGDPRNFAFLRASAPVTANVLLA